MHSFGEAVVKMKQESYTFFNKKGEGVARECQQRLYCRYLMGLKLFQSVAMRRN
jgi:hypothetical protein